MRAEQRRCRARPYKQRRVPVDERHHAFSQRLSPRRRLPKTERYVGERVLASAARARLVVVAQSRCPRATFAGAAEPGGTPRAAASVACAPGMCGSRIGLMVGKAPAASVGDVWREDVGLCVVIHDDSVPRRRQKGGNAVGANVVAPVGTQRVGRAKLIAHPVPLAQQCPIRRAAAEAAVVHQRAAGGVAEGLW